MITREITDEKVRRLWEELASWSQATFGLDTERDAYPVLNHLLREVEEARREMDRKVLHWEIADCFLLILDAARRTGMDLQDLTVLAITKLDENRERQWAEADAEGVIEHVREQEASQ